ncbi:hypothetical protein [Burkholderia ubonensis]|uniref:hypothetical protein n=1 Tax=Burkholderia ubonensis TaxID=101571 RepID=UPI000A9B9E5F|nr:hypothetical protein [Burkholderia ubonensis]
MTNDSGKGPTATISVFSALYIGPSNAVVSRKGGAQWNFIAPTVDWLDNRMVAQFLKSMIFDMNYHEGKDILAGFE